MISTKQTQTTEKGKLKNSGWLSGCTVTCGGGSFHLHINRTISTKKINSNERKAQK
jgi:hypothetical protein